MYKVEKIYCLELIPPAEIVLQIKHIARILFGLKGNFELMGNRKVLSIGDEEYFFVNTKTGYFEFTHPIKLNSVYARKKNQLPKNADDAKMKATGFLSNKDQEIRADKSLQGVSFPALFENLEIVNASPIQHSTENRIDHWECIFKVMVPISKVSKEKIVAKGHQVVLKLCSEKNIIALKYATLPIFRKVEKDKIETKHTQMITNVKNQSEKERKELVAKHNINIALKVEKESLNKVITTLEDEKEALMKEINDLKTQIEI